MGLWEFFVSVGLRKHSGDLTANAAVGHLAKRGKEASEVVTFWRIDQKLAAFCFSLYISLLPFYQDVPLFKGSRAKNKTWSGKKKNWFG